MSNSQKKKPKWPGIYAKSSTSLVAREMEIKHNEILHNPQLAMILKAEPGM